MVTVTELTATLESYRPLIQGKRVKLDFGAEGHILLDGLADRISNDDLPADAVISASLEDFVAISTGRLSGVMAFMQGRLRIAGDMNTARRFQEASRKFRPPGDGGFEPRT